VIAVTIGSSGLCCSISLCKSILGSGTSSHSLTVVMQVVSYPPLLIRWPCQCISLPSRPLFHMLPSFLIPLRAFDTFALLFATRLSKIHTIIFKRYSPSGHLTLAPHSQHQCQMDASADTRHLHLYVFNISANNLARYLL
jgi:hypothetical protein